MYVSKVRSIIYLGTVIGILFSPLAFAQEANSQNASNLVTVRRQQLEAQLKQIEKEISDYQTLINSKQKEVASFARDVAILDAKIGRAKLEIRSLETLISKLGAQIQEKEKSIITTVTTIDRKRESLAASIKKVREFDDVSMLEVLLSYDKVSTFFSYVDSYDRVQLALQTEANELREFKSKEENLRLEFIAEREDQQQARSLLVLEKTAIEQQEKERSKLLRESKGTAAVYQQYVSRRANDASSIRTQLFMLEGSPAISFEKAVALAENASRATGVRVAFILGILAQESALGKNIGQCNLPGDPPKYRWEAIMKPSRDHAPYLNITKRLGLDPNAMPLSCPQSVGYGGAMGPAQFIPSTWVIFEDRVAKATGHNPANPWNPEDAFMASAIYLSDLGADSISGEREAAGRYYAGSRWNGTLGQRYAGQVLAKADTYQQQINIIKGLAIATDRNN